MAEGARAAAHAHRGHLVLKLTPERWREVEPLLAEALDMDAPARGSWLAAIESSRPTLAPFLKALLAAHESGERVGALETGPRLSSAHAPASFHEVGARVGPFELVRLLGRGGMGEVWLARQVDGRVQREVALKLPVVFQHGAVWRERFRRERDILARLEHPHIARFYDAGVDASGQPWLAMECVLGTTLLDYSTARGLPVPMRLALFRQVLEAVAHAHRHLVVHRDLKPGNILVDDTGEVKLLDFGIAKLVQEEQGDQTVMDLTRLGGRLMTLRYAAPEQVAGEAITTATDVYALGVVLHELVTGQSPYRGVREGKAPTEAMLLEETPTLPSRLAPGVGADLDAILLKALRREPSQRYASVELLDADIAAHLQQRPVKARAGTWRYLAGRFLARHKLPTALAAAVLVSLVAGLVVAEGERRKAVAERARAERHFASVRKLANTFIFDVHGKLENLPGSLAARELLIATSLDYLDALSRDSGRDPALLLDIATAYRTVATIQGQPRGANRGNVAAAIANYEKAKKVLLELEALKPGDVAVTRELWRTSYQLGRSYYQVFDPKWRGELRYAVTVAERLASAPGIGLDERLVGVFTGAHEAYAAAIATGRTPGIEGTVLGAIARFEQARPAGRSDALYLERLASLYRWAGTIIAGPGEGTARPAEAIPYLEKSVDLAREWASEAPADSWRKRTENMHLMVLARLLASQGSLHRADLLMTEAVTQTEKLFERDPDDIDLAIDRMAHLVAAADVAYRLGNARRAELLARDVVAATGHFSPEVLALRDVRIALTEAKVILGYALLSTAESARIGGEARLARLVEARDLFGEVALFLADVEANPTLGSVPEYKLREFAAARERCEKALRKLSAG